jgi:hypothetical protein
MPDSFPPLTWGPPFDERDLDALLSGHMADTPLALRQVADALTALRAAPTPAERSGEAAARAEFRALAELRADDVGRADEPAYTLIMSAMAPARPSRRPARHRAALRARRDLARPPRRRRLSRRGGALVAAAGVALIVAIIALTGSLPGPIHPLGHPLAAGKTSASSSAGSASEQARSAAREPTHKPAPSHPASVTPSASSTPPPQSEAKSLCREFFGYFRLPVQPREWPAEKALLAKIYKLAGKPFPFDVNIYCAHYVQDMFPQGVPRIPADLSRSVPGGQNGPGNGPGQGTMNGKPVNN